MQSLPASFSIVRRLTALVMSVSVLALFLNGVLMFRMMRPLGEDLAEAMVRQISLARAALHQAHAEQREALAEAMSNRGLRLHRELRKTVELPELGPLITQMRQALGPEVRLAMVAPEADVNSPSHTLLASFEVDGERWQLELPSKGPPPQGPLLPSLAALGLIGLAVALATVMGVRLVTQPIARIASEMSLRHEDLRPLEPGPRIGRELQIVVLAFNGLVEALARARETRRYMLAGLSHDLRTPLARLRLRVECECSEPVAAKMASDFHALSRIIDQFLDYARGGAGSGGGAAAGYLRPLDELLREIALPYAGQGVTLQIEASAAEAATTSMWPDLALQRLLGNLVDNALVHGRTPVVIQLVRQGPELQLWVQDAGRGIPASNLAQALKPFVKLRGDEGHNGNGHCGLGLTIVAQIAEQLGGRLLHRPHDGHSFALGVALPCAT